MEWGELAAHLGISRSMLDQVRKGTRNPGPKLVRRIEAAESAAGISRVFQGLEKGGAGGRAPPKGPPASASQIAAIRRQMEALARKLQELEERE